MSGKLIPEWNEQDAIVIAWPNKDTDWRKNLSEVTSFYKELSMAIIDHQKLIILYSGTPPELQSNKNIILINVPFNDTWTRDYIGLSVQNKNGTQLIDFGFNGWGEKFDFQIDNKVNQFLEKKAIFSQVIQNENNFILEGGSIDVNSDGVLLTTSKCLLNKNRNPDYSKEELEIKLKTALGVSKVIWLNNGLIKGDDTDAHIDILARFCNDNTIIYTQGDSESLKDMEIELKELDYNLIPLPLPSPIFFNKQELPASYANFLITNQKVLCPTYNDKNDEVALKQLTKAFPFKKIVGINALPLIKQNGSLHCVTMQLAKGILK